MEYKKLNNTDMEISALTLGTWVFGGTTWQGAKDSDCIDAVKAAIDCGINCIDTAPIYSEGISESLVGRGIKGQRDKVFIATKCGITGKNGKIICDLSREGLLKEIDESLKRLNTDYIDIYQCHWPDEKTSIEETMNTLNELKDKGKIHHIGVSNYGKKLIQECQKYADIVTSQDQYSMLERGIEEELLPFTKENNIGIFAYGPLAGGILTGKYDKSPNFKGADARNFFYKYYQGDAFEKTKELLQSLESIGKPMNQIAINWVIQQEGVASVLVGSRNPKQVEDNAASCNWKLEDEHLTMIKDLLKGQVYG